MDSGLPVSVIKTFPLVDQSVSLFEYNVFML